MAVAARSRTRGAGPRRPAAVDRVGGRSGVADIQRLRIITAMAVLARERGAAAVTVADVVERSGVSRRTFYELFGDRNDCFAAAFDHGIARAAARIVPAYESAGDWRERMRAGLAGALAFLEEEPELGALCVAVALGASPMTPERRSPIVETLVEAVDAGRSEARASARPARLTAEGAVGAVLSVLHSRLVAREPVLGLQGSLMGMIVLPYLGLATAAQEALATRRTAQPAAPATAAPPSSDALRDAGMRLTYRTVRVLLAIADLVEGETGPSNRQVADYAGVSDQGQISKLLARLEHLGLIYNSGVGSARGGPNLWRLTPKGAEIERVVRWQGMPR